MEKGTSILHYKILDKLGEGGMGVVFKARDTKLDRTVALKFLPPSATQTGEDRQRFIREAKAAAALNHPNICTIHSVEEHDGRQFISMEFVDGQTLQHRLEAQQPDLKTAVTFAVQIAEALAKAHSRGIVHRDIKPSNIMIDEDGRIKVMDFGLARMKDSEELTQMGTTVGTMGYMSPEQVLGEAVDHRSDIFSFGVVLYEMLTGTRPFRGEHKAATLYSIANEEPKSLSEVLPGIPQRLSDLVKRMLEKDPDIRYSSADEVTADLETCLNELSGLEQASPEKVEQTTGTLASDLSSVGEKQNSSGSGSTSITINLPAIRSRAGMASLAAGILFLALIGYWLVPFFSSSAIPQDNTIAVLPLESFSQNEDDIQFTNGIHEELINRLAGIRDLTVIARRSVLGFPSGERDDLQSIGRQLGVSSLMDGTVRFSGDRIRVSVQLIDVNTLGTLWSGSFDENIDDVFEIQSRIAQQVANELQASLTQEEQQRLEERPTDNPQAYRLYMQGREYLSRTVSNENNLPTAEKLLRKAVEEDREFAQAWAMLAYTYSRLYWIHGRKPEQLQKMSEAAEWALYYGPDLAETYIANGVYLYWSNTNNEQTLTHFETALQKFPNQPELHLMTALTHRRLGNWEELIEHLNKALELDPLSTNLYTELIWNYWLVRDYDKAVEYSDRLVELKPDIIVNIPIWAYSRTLLSKDGTLEGFERWWDHIHPSDPAIEVPYHWAKYNMLKRDWEKAIRGYKYEGETIASNDVSYILRDYVIGVALEFQGHRTQAFDYYEQARNHLEYLCGEYPNEFRYRMALGKLYARLGEEEKAVQEGEKGTQLMPLSQDAFIAGALEKDLAEIYTWTGHEELAVEKLEYLLSVPSTVHRNDLRMDPVWDPLRDHPRFQELVAGEDKPYMEGL